MSQAGIELSLSAVRELANAIQERSECSKGKGWPEEGVTETPSLFDSGRREIEPSMNHTCRALVIIYKRPGVVLDNLS